jgi:hypothetical protein
LSADAVDDDDPSPFTAALVDVLLDPELKGDESGLLTPQVVYSSLMARRPSLVPQPKISGEFIGRLGLARRALPAAAEEPPLRGWVDVQEFETIELEISASSVVARVVGQPDDVWELHGFDAPRRSAVELLGLLADGVASSTMFGADDRLSRALERAWACVGANLFETSVPPTVRSRVAELDAAGGKVLRVLLRFMDDAGDLEPQPWELLRPCDPVDQDDTPLALRRGVLLQRAGPVDAVKPSAPSHSVVVLDPYEGAFGKGCRTISAQIDNTPGLLLVKDLHGREATFGNFVDLLDQRPRHLVLCVPIRHEEGGGEIGFARAQGDQQDWRSVRTVLQQFTTRSLACETIVLVTFAAPPGVDSFRSIYAVAAELAREGRGAVAFACHAPGYEMFLGDPANPTFPGLLLDALSRPEKHTLDRCFWYARERSLTLADAASARAFGVPGLYAPPELAGTGVTTASTPGGTGGLAPSKTHTPGSAARHGGKPSGSRLTQQGGG